MRQDLKPTAFVLVGVPCSGKTYWAQNHPEKFEIASTDAYIERVAVEQSESYGDVFADAFPLAQRKMKEQVRGLIEARKPFIWDQINISRKEREGIYRLLHPTHKVTYVCFLVPIGICLERFEKRGRDGGNAVNPQRIINLAKKTAFPDKTEPHDEIVRLVHPKWLDSKTKKQP